MSMRLTSLSCLHALECPLGQCPSSLNYDSRLYVLRTQALLCLSEISDYYRMHLKAIAPISKKKIPGIKFDLYKFQISNKIIGHRGHFLTTAISLYGYFFFIKIAVFIALEMLFQLQIFPLKICQSCQK